MVTPVVHFWDDMGCKSELLPVLDPNNDRVRYSTQNAWTDVARHVYPSLEVIDCQEWRWLVQRELFLGPDSRPDPEKPDAIVVRRVRIDRGSATGEDGPPQYHRYNWVTIEVEPPGQDTPEGWRGLLQRACSRAASHSCGVHDVFIICAVGLKYMIFSWDPRNTDIPAQELRLSVAGADVHFPSQLSPMSGLSPHVPKLGAPGDPDQYRLDPSCVWSIDPGQVDESGQGEEPLKALENFLKHTRFLRLQNPYQVYD